MERFTGDVRVPPGLALKAYRHRQKRRMTGRVAAAAGTATVVAGSLAIAGATGAFGSGQAPVQTDYTGYVITHVEHALAAPRIGNLVEADRTAFSPGSTLHPFPQALIGTADGAGSSPANYLPVKADLGPRQTEFHWLAPTLANLAHLKVTVPAGFKQVPAPAPPAGRAP
jgi:hypothetical protein